MLCFMEDDDGATEEKAKRRPKLTISEVEYNVAIWKLTKGKGSLLRNLAVVASYGRNEDVTVDGLKAIVKRVEFEYSPDEIEPCDGLEPDEARYLAKRYGASDDPAVREWLASNASPTRSRPDWRRSSDRAGAHGKPTRIRVKRVSQ
jgi:hypothetical protein